MSRKKSGGVGLDHDDDETLDQLKELAQQAGLRDDGRPDDRAEIKLQADRVVENIDAIEAACIARNALLWQRDRAVVNVGLKKYKTADDREAITLCVRDMTTPRLFKIVARYCKFRKFDMRTEDWRAVEPPMKLLKSFRQSELRLPVIKGVLDHPFFRSDWSLVTTPGFDQQSGIFCYDHGLKFPPVPDNPTRDDAVEALKRVKHLFHTFDFVDEANRSVSVIALMTGLCRHMFGAAPIFSIDATMPGSGKGLIVKVISAIVIGDLPPLINQGSTPEETEKRLGSMLREALRIVVFDNCLDDIGGALLCSLATEERVSIRILAKTERHAVSLGSLLIFNGNNVTFRGEVTSRALNSRLDPQCENPDNRHFDYNPVKDANENRPELVAAILTMMQAYKAAGFPDMPKIASRFPDWDRLRGMLTWAGMEDPYETTLKIKRDDPETAEFRAVLQHWFTVIYTRVEMTLGDIVDCAVKRVPIKEDDIIKKNPDGETMYEYAHPEFRQALLAVASSGDNRRIDTKALGHWLHRIIDRIITLDMSRVEGEP